MNVQRIDGGGKVHGGRVLLRMNGMRVVIDCTGRAMRDMIETRKPVTCRVCLKRKERNA